MTNNKPTRDDYRRQLADQHPRARHWSNAARGLVVDAPLEDGPRIIAEAKALGLHVLHQEPIDTRIRFEISSFARRRHEARS